MENLDIYSLIDKSLKYYDKQNTKYKNFIDNNNVSFNRDKVEIYFNDGEDKETFKYQGAGIFDGFTKIALTDQPVNNVAPVSSAGTAQSGSITPSYTYTGISDPYRGSGSRVVS